jgi:hypothetical protein
MPAAPCVSKLFLKNEFQETTDLTEEITQILFGEGNCTFPLRLETANNTGTPELFYQL